MKAFLSYTISILIGALIISIFVGALWVDGKADDEKRKEKRQILELAIRNVTLRSKREGMQLLKEEAVKEGAAHWGSDSNGCVILIWDKNGEG